MKIRIKWVGLRFLFHLVNSHYYYFITPDYTEEEFHCLKELQIIKTAFIKSCLMIKPPREIVSYLKYLIPFLCLQAAVCIYETSPFTISIVFFSTINLTIITLLSYNLLRSVFSYYKVYFKKRAYLQLIFNRVTSVNSYEEFVRKD